ncbi:MAG: heavy metal-responsive transcriptional regulator [Armatimonadetes bacterium]|nr:heavy metal-responsive transcriptional regulator [Armatimonadota bacterium]
MNCFRIGQLAFRSGVGIQTIRYYERRGLLPNPLRSESNYRLYPGNAVGVVRFIKQTQMLGFSLSEIKSLLSLRSMENARCSDVRKRAQAKISQIEEKIKQLETMKQALARLEELCSKGGSVRECPILEALEETGAVRESREEVTA